MSGRHAVAVIALGLTLLVALFLSITGFEFFGSGWVWFQVVFVATATLPLAFVNRPKGFAWTGLLNLVVVFAWTAAGGFFGGTHLYLPSAILLLLAALLSRTWQPKLMNITSSIGFIVGMMVLMGGLGAAWERLAPPVGYTAYVEGVGRFDHFQDRVFSIESVESISYEGPPTAFIRVYFEPGLTTTEQARVGRDLLAMPEVIRLQFCCYPPRD